MLLVLNKADFRTKTTPADLGKSYPDIPVLEISALRKRAWRSFGKKSTSFFLLVIPMRGDRRLPNPG